MKLSLQTNVSLQPLNTMAVPAQAHYFAEVTSVDEITAGVEFAQQNGLDIFVLGEGSNTLFTQDYSGLVLQSCLLGMEILAEDDQTVLLKVASGENWHRFVTYTIQQGWYGLENLALIPGSVGAAPIQNIGAYGVEVNASIVNVEFFQFDTRKLTSLANSQCQFDYRDSIFKHSLKGQGFITAVVFRLNKVAKPMLSYPALAASLSAVEAPSPSHVFAAVVKIRSEKLPAPSAIPNLGSFFKNPVVDERTHQRLQHGFPDLVSYPQQQGYKLAAAWLIEKAGWKVKSHSSVRVHATQALVIINPEHANGVQILEFANQIRCSIQQMFSIELEIEPNII